MFKKDKDVTVCLTGTSLTQGNLYATTRDDATERPTLLHTNDLGASRFISLMMLCLKSYGRDKNIKDTTIQI